MWKFITKNTMKLGITCGIIAMITFLLSILSAAFNSVILTVLMGFLALCSLLSMFGLFVVDVWTGY